MNRLIETEFSTLKADMECVFSEFSNEESAERVIRRVAWRRAERPSEGEIFSTIGKADNERLCIAAMLPGPRPRVALVAIWTRTTGNTTVEIIGAAREPDLPLKIFQLAESWREASGVKTEQRSHKKWSGLENPN